MLLRRCGSRLPPPPVHTLHKGTRGYAARSRNTATTGGSLLPADFRFPAPPRGAATSSFLKVILRNGSHRKRALVALHQDPDRLARKKLLLPSLASTSPAVDHLSLEALEADLAAFKRANGLPAQAEVPLYCVTIRELGRRGGHALADRIARKLIAANNSDSAEGGDLLARQRLYSALLEGRCMGREAEGAARLYLEMVEERNLLPSHRALHMLMELLSNVESQSRQKQKRRPNPESAVELLGSHQEEEGDEDEIAKMKTKTKTSEKAKEKEKEKAKMRGEGPVPQLKVAEMFEEMKARGHLTTAAYNMLLPVVGRKERRLSSLKNVLGEMVANKVPRNQRTWSALLECARSPEEFEQIKNVMRANGWRPEHSANAVLRVLPKYVSTNELLEFLEANVHSVHAPTFNSLILSYSQAGNFVGAFASARKMRKAHFLPSKKAFLSFLKCGGYALQEYEIEWMWRDLTGKLERSGRKINRDFYHAKMIAYLRRKNPEAVRRTLAEMQEQGVEPNNYTYYLLIMVDDVDGFF